MYALQLQFCATFTILQLSIFAQPQSKCLLLLYSILHLTIHHFVLIFKPASIELAQICMCETQLLFSSKYGYKKYKTSEWKFEIVLNFFSNGAAEFRPPSRAVFKSVSERVKSSLKKS
jgi:hypothetical protein